MWHISAVQAVSEVSLGNGERRNIVVLFMRQSTDVSVNSRPGNRVGYVRVSTVTQTLEQQQAALEVAGVEKTFSDTMSGARDDRPGLAALLEYVREGDTVVMWKLDDWAATHYTSWRRSRP